MLPGPEAFDTAFVLLKFANGKEAAIDVCRKATYGYDQRAEVSLVCSSSSKYYVVVSRVRPPTTAATRAPRCSVPTL